MTGNPSHEGSRWQRERPPGRPPREARAGPVSGQPLRKLTHHRQFSSEQECPQHFPISWAEAMMPRPEFKNEWNITTVIALVLFVATVIGWAQSYGRFSQRVDVLERDATTWRESHLQFHRERAQELANSQGRTDERLKQLEGQARAVDNLTYRMTVQEQGTTSLTAAVADLRQTINNVTGDIRLIREIVTRLESRPDGKGQP